MPGPGRPGQTAGAGCGIYFYCRAGFGGMELLAPSISVTERKVWLRWGMQFGRSTAEVEAIA